MNDINNKDDLVKIFNNCYFKIESYLSDIFDNKSFDIIDDNMEVVNNIIKFYEIITEFLIRFYNYSIIGISNQKYIVTASSNCEKEFFEYLDEGYVLYHLQKVNIENGKYYFLPALPSNDIWISYDEFIEEYDENNGVNKKMIKIQKNNREF